MPPAPDSELLAELDRRLAKLREMRPELEEAIALQGGLVRARVEMLEPDVPPLSLAPEVAAERLRSGTPLLHQAPAFVDVGWAAGLFGRLVEVAADAHQADSEANVEALATALRDGLLDTESLFQEAFVQHREHVAHLATEAELDPDLLSSLAWLAVAPLLAAYARQLGPYVESGGADWRRGYCPVCGVWPAFVEQRGVHRDPWLRCLSCGTAWPGPAEACVFCGAAKPLPAGVVGDPRFGAQFCWTCRGYLKVVRTFEPSPTELLPLDDLASVHLDVEAQERGYTRPSEPGFPIELADDAGPPHLG